MRAGSSPSKTAALVPVSVTRAACSSESHCIRCSIQGGTKSSVSSSAQLEPRPLDEVVPPEDVDVLGAVLVAGPRDRARSVLHPEVGRDAEHLARLDVGAEADEQLGEAFEVGGAVAHGAADYTTMRLNAFLARAGVASRRKADELIKAGRVRVNGELGELNTFVESRGRRRGRRAAGREAARWRTCS